MNITAKLKRRRSFLCGSRRVERSAGSTVTIKLVDRSSGNLLLDFGFFAGWFHKSILTELELEHYEHQR